MPPRKTQTIKDVMKESQPIIDQKLGATRSKKVKKNDSDEDSDFITTSTKSKQKNSNAPSKIKSSLNKQKESLNQYKDDPKDQLSPELKPSSQRQKARTKGEKIQDKHIQKTEEVKNKQQNEDENNNKDNDNDHQNNKEPNQQGNQVVEENKENNENINDNNNKDNNNNEINQQQIKSNDKQDNLNNKDQSQVPDEQQQDKNHNQQVNQEQQQAQQLEDRQNQVQKESILNSIPLVNAPSVNVTINEKKDQQNLRQSEEEEKEQQEKQLKGIQSNQISETNVDIVFCCDINLLEGHSVDYLKNTIEFIIEQLKEKEHQSSSIKFSIVRFNDHIINEKSQQSQVIDLCDGTEILQSLEEIKSLGQIEIKKGLYQGLKLATQNTKWRKLKSYRYIIHIANQQLELDNKSEELENIIQEMNNKNIRYKYLRIDKKIDLDFDGKQYLQNKLNSYEESFLREFGCLKNVVSSIMLREIIHENNK